MVNRGLSAISTDGAVVSSMKVWVDHQMIRQVKVRDLRVKVKERDLKMQVRDSQRGRARADGSATGFTADKDRLGKGWRSFPDNFDI